MKLLTHALILFTATFLTGCKHKEVSAETFMRELCEGAEKQNTYWSSEFSGIKDGRAYLKYWRASPKVLGGEKLYSVSVSELPPGFSPDQPLNSCVE